MIVNSFVVGIQVRVLKMLLFTPTPFAKVLRFATVVAEQAPLALSNLQRFPAALQLTLLINRSTLRFGPC